ncbi:hypothetical protein OOU_Y34scaffold00719g6 [Pyricularia oryzae Y34]|uniref:Uncharacterized protein n=2 Tax=Pyricularia oryzae TaxID=318829 RepID=A0AA97PHY4_PYRO3|nr:hypothetical protein OOU_Y34scaffold00719g6 [Pyricularia oryzae Y34]
MAMTLLVRIWKKLILGYSKNQA